MGPWMSRFASFLWGTRDGGTRKLTTSSGLNMGQLGEGPILDNSLNLWWHEQKGSIFDSFYFCNFPRAKHSTFFWVFVFVLLSQIILTMEVVAYFPPLMSVSISINTDSSNRRELLLTLL